MTTTRKFEKQAAKESKDGSTRYVVYVFDQGADVFDGEQARRYGPLVQIESAWLNGQCIATLAAARDLLGY